ncbi:MAG: O-antigen ligase family protein, partial [Pseudomonadota bacterium]
FGSALPLMGMGLLFVFRNRQEAGDPLRAQFWQNTWAATLDYLPFGTGLGGFHVIYPRYERMDQDLSVFANYAHNDWLEALLETGIFGLALLCAVTFFVFKKSQETPLKVAALIGLVALAVHSLVDYPLRTMPIAMLAAFYVGVIWQTVTFEEKQKY